MNNSTSTQLVLRGLEGNEPAHLSGIQPFLVAHIEIAMALWWSIFFLTGAIALGILIYDIRKRMKAEKLLSTETKKQRGAR